MIPELDAGTDLRDHPSMDGNGVGMGRWRAERAVFLALLLLALLLVLRILLPFAAVILVALATAGLVAPASRRLQKLLGGHRRLAALLICLLLMAAVLVPILLTVEAVSQEALGFYRLTTVQLSEESFLQVLERHQDTIDRVNRALAPLGIRFTAERIYDDLATVGVKLGGFFYRQGVSLAKGLARLVFAFAFWLLILFYLLVDGKKLWAWLQAVLPIPIEHQRLVAERFTGMAGSILVGNGLAGILQGLVGALVFAAAGIPGPVLWGVVMAVLAFIPIVGISLVYIPVSLILLAGSGLPAALEVFVPLFIVATVVEYWLKPMLVGRRAQMHTLLVFLSILGGLDAFGPSGLVLGPLLMTGFLTLVELYCESYHPFCEEEPGTDDAGEDPGGEPARDA